MTDNPAPEAATVQVWPSAMPLQAKAQLRILLAAVAGMLVGKHILPAGMLNDTVLDAISALAIYALMAGWQWARVRLQHTRWWALANDRRVPNDLVRPAPTGT